MTVSRTQRHGLAAMALLALLAACAESPPPRLFLLAPKPPLTTHDFAGTIALKSVDVPAYLDRPQLVRLTDGYEVQLSELERWGEGTHEMTTRVLVNNLAQRLPESQIFAASGPLSVEADIVLEVEMTRFDAEPNGVTLAGQWVVRRDGTQRQVRAATIHVDASSMAAGSIVAAMSEALAGFADRIAASVDDGRRPTASAKRQPRRR